MSVGPVLRRRLVDLGVQLTEGGLRCLGVPPPRALLLLGIPGTAKTWVSEHLAAAISGDSTLLVQGTAGTTEESLRYGWNYARLLAEGPSPQALVASPVLRAMETGRPMVRAANDGVSAVIDSQGRVIASAPEYEANVMRSKVQPRIGLTPYARIGNWPVVCLALGFSLAGAYFGRRRKLA